MDPDFTLQELDRCLRDEGDAEGAREYCGYLREWIEQGGFEPDWSKYPRAYVYYLHRCALRLDDVRFSRDAAIAEILLHYYGR